MTDNVTTDTSDPDEAIYANFENALRLLYEGPDEDARILPERVCAPMRQLIAKHGLEVVAHRQQLTRETVNNLVSRLPWPTAAPRTKRRSK